LSGGHCRYGYDFTIRAKVRREYMAAGADYSKLCPDAGLMLDSFLQVGLAPLRSRQRKPAAAWRCRPALDA
jgi:hypothetical protein